MAVESGFFASLNGDRKYGADDLSDFLLNLITDGVLASPSTNLEPRAVTSGLVVRVLPGWGAIKAKYVHNTSDVYISLIAANSSLPRIDRIVLRLDPSERKITITKKTGTPAEEPVPPALIRGTNGIWELSLAQVFIAPGVTMLSSAALTDERADETVCGYVTWVGGLPDTSELTKRLGGISFVKLTQAEYDALTEKDPDTEYFVVGTGGSVKSYFSDSSLSSGSISNSVSLSVSRTNSFTAQVTEK